MDFDYSVSIYGIDYLKTALTNLFSPKQFPALENKTVNIITSSSNPKALSDFFSEICDLYYLSGQGKEFSAEFLHNITKNHFDSYKDSN